MAQTKKQGASKKKGSSAKRKTSQKRSQKNSFFNSEHKQIFSFIGFFFAIFMLAVVIIDAGSVWGALRNFFFGLFGINSSTFLLNVL